MMRFDTGNSLLNKLIGNESAASELAGKVIDAGDRFWQVGSGAIWQVEKTCKLAFTEALHVALQRVDKSSGAASGDSKVIALESLMDPTQYRRENRAQGSGNTASASEHRRRRSDAPKAN